MIKTFENLPMGAVFQMGGFPVELEKTHSDAAVYGTERVNLRVLADTQVKLVRLPKTWAGSLSTGTMRTEAVYDAVEHLLTEELIEEYTKARLQDLREAEDPAGPLEDAPETHRAKVLNEDIWDYLNEIAPNGYYFGAHPGDGSDFGFWPTESE